MHIRTTGALVLFTSLLATAAGGCRRPEVRNPPPVVPPSTDLPCGEFLDVPLSCMSDIGDFNYTINIQVYCDPSGIPDEMYTSQGITSPRNFSLGSVCSLDQVEWVINSDRTGANVDCTNPWGGNGGSDRYNIELLFTSNAPGNVHGEVHFMNVHTDHNGVVYSPGYSDCTF